MREKFDDEISDDGKNAEQEYYGVGRRSCEARVGGWLRLSMCCKELDEEGNGESVCVCDVNPTSGCKCPE